MQWVDNNADNGGTHKSQRDIFEALWQFFWGDRTQPIDPLPRARHRCSRHSCNYACATVNGVSQMGRKQEYRRHSQISPPMYNLGRWTKHVLCQQWFSELICLDHQASVRAIRAVASAQKANDTRGKRVGKSVDKCSAGCRFSCIATSVCATLLEGIVSLLFGGNAMETRSE